MSKTTLCIEIAYQWATKQLLQDTQLVLLMSLYNPIIQQIMNIEDLVHYFYHFDTAAAETSKVCARYMLENKGKHVLIILDGCDECLSLPENSLISHILRCDFLMNCRLIVTSRPIASQELQSIADV